MEDKFEINVNQQWLCAFQMMCLQPPPHFDRSVWTNSMPPANGAAFDLNHEVDTNILQNTPWTYILSEYDQTYIATKMMCVHGNAR